MRNEASLLNIEKMSRLGALLQLPGTTPQFQKSIQAQMEQIAKEMEEQAAPPDAAASLASVLAGAPTAPAAQTNAPSPALQPSFSATPLLPAPPATAANVLLSPQAQPRIS